MHQFCKRRLFVWCLLAITGPWSVAQAEDRAKAQNDAASVGGKEAVTIEQTDDGLAVKIKGEEFTVFHHGATLPKPYFWPVRGPGGAILTRPNDPNEKEHPHHRGIWLSVDEVNHVRFWAEKGRIVTTDVKSKSGNPGTIEMTNEWIGLDGTPALIEKTIVSIYPERLITYDTTLAPPVGKLARFDDTKEGFFGFRVAQSMREKEGGIVTNSDGKKTTAECWGQPAKWVDYTGVVDAKTYGVALMDHPGNFRPSRYHVRDYGLFSMSPFGEGAYQNDESKSQPVILDADTPSLRFRFGAYIHAGNATEGKVAEAYKQFIEVTK
ncbi:PmoA family protein [Schlesneria sp. T3-172]|uniref:DUF6807 domain-containing protein n=1 Tax=Schlesneria sphaerica TaxID=3373610 RepID=UPI0037C67CAE